MVVVYSEGVRKWNWWNDDSIPKTCIKDDKQSFLFNECLFKGERKSCFHYQTLIWNVLNQFVLKQIQCNSKTFQKCLLICKPITKMYLCRLYVNDDYFNAKLLLPTTLSDQGDSDKHDQISHKQNTLLLWLKQEAKMKTKENKENKKISNKRKMLRKMTSKNQMRWFTDFWCPSPQFSLSQIREEKAVDWFQVLNRRKTQDKEEGHKIWTKKCLFLRKKSVKGQ